MGFFDNPIWNTIGNVLQKGQSGMTGATLGLMREFGNDPKWAKDLFPEARTITGGLKSGLSESIKPHQVLFGKTGVKPLDMALGATADMFYDPLMIAGGLSSTAGTGIKGIQTLEGLKGAISAEEAAAKVPKAVNLLNNAFGTARESGVGRLSLENLAGLGARTARRGYQGTLATDDNNALTGLQAGMALGALEGGITKLAPRGLAITKLLNKSKPAAAVATEAAPEVVEAAVKASPVDDLVGKASPVEELIGGTGAARTKISSEPLIGEATPSVRDIVNRDLADLAARATPPKPSVSIVPEQTNGQKMIADMIATKKPPVPTGPNPNIEAGLGAPASGPVDLYEGPVGPPLSQTDMPNFLRRSPPTPQEQAIEQVLSRQPQPLSDFDKWRQANVGPFTPTAASEAITPQDIAFFLQNYGG